MTPRERVKVYIDGCSGNILEAKRDELLTETDNIVIPAVIVANQMQNLESTSV